MTHCALQTIPLNYSSWHDSIMTLYHNAQALGLRDSGASVVEPYQVTDFHRLSSSPASKPCPTTIQHYL